MTGSVACLADDDWRGGCLAIAFLAVGVGVELQHWPEYVQAAARLYLWSSREVPVRRVDDSWV